MKTLTNILEVIIIAAFIALIAYTGFHVCQVDITLFAGL